MRSTGNLSPRHGVVAFGRSTAAAALVVAAAAAIVPRPASAQTSPFYAVTYLDVATTSVPQGIEIVKKFRDASRRETGNLEFTTLQETSRPNRFVIMEGWQSQAGYEGHDKGTTMSEFQAALKPIRNSPTNPHTLLPFANVAPRTIPPGALYMVEHVD